MNIFKKIYCRSFQFIFKIAMPFLPYKEPKILTKLSDITIELNNLSISNVLLVTDAGIVKAKILQPIMQLLKENNIQFFIFDKTSANPTVNNVEEARAFYLENKCKAIIAIGGGSSIDCAKALGARIAYPKKNLDKLKGLLKVKRKIPPLFAIPTTAGTGSEVTLTTVITDSEKKHKYTLNSFTLIPKYAILDPTVTYTLPQHFTATTGMDALTHAIEAYIGKSTTKLTRACSLKAIKLIFDNILIAYEDGKNEKARSNMLKASYLAGIAFSRSYVGYIHAIAHSLGGQYNIEHGLANAIIMPYVLKAYGKSIYKKLYKLGVYVGIVNQDKDYKKGALKFIDAIINLNKKLNIPTKIDGIDKNDIAKMANNANKEANPLYPVPRLMNAKQLERIYYEISSQNLQ